MMLIDTHCHLDVEDFDPDRAEVLARSRAAGLTDIVVPAIHARGWPGLIALCSSSEPMHPRLHPALGLHPVYIDRHRDSDVTALEHAVRESAAVAIGEIGLDYFVPDLDPVRQQDLFEAQLGVAQRLGLPVLLHVRKAHDQVLATLRRLPVRGGIAHAFNGSLQQAGLYLDLGFRLGFGGMLTFERSTRIRRLAAELPLDAIVLETDAPDMAVAAHHGERNSPEYLPQVLSALAEVRGAEPETLAAAVSANARGVLSLP